MLLASPTFKPPPRRPRRCARSPAASPSRSLLSALIDTGLLAVPVLAGSAGYAVGEALRVEGGIGPTPRPRASVLRHDRVSHLSRRNSELSPARSPLRPCSGA